MVVEGGEKENWSWSWKLELEIRISSIAHSHECQNARVPGSGCRQALAGKAKSVLTGVTGGMQTRRFRPSRALHEFIDKHAEHAVISQLLGHNLHH
jgi:hypothetical protein